MRLEGLLDQPGGLRPLPRRLPGPVKPTAVRQRVRRAYCDTCWQLQLPMTSTTSTLHPAADSCIACLSPAPHRPRLFKKGECQADGCSADLSGLPRYHQRNHICVPHKVADEFWRLGVLVRFCQRCG